MAGIDWVELPYAGAFSLRDTLKSGQVFHWEPLSLEGREGVAGCIGDGPPAFLYQDTLSGAAWTPAGDAERVRRYFGLDQDLAAIHASFPGDDRVLQEAMAFCPGIRVLRQPLWECLATFITSSMKRVSHIRAIALTLRQRYGAPHLLAGRPFYAYPRAETLASLSEAALRDCALGYRAKSLLLAAQAVAEGELDLAAVEAEPSLDLARERLMSLYGVGAKIADCALLFGAGRWEAFPIDVWMERVLRERYRKRLKAEKLRAWAAKHFGPCAGYAQQYLFHFSRKTL